MKNRVVFFLSDQTGVTAETLGRTLLTQFEGHHFDQVTLPFINSIDKADEAVRRINATAEETGTRPLIFSTLVQDEIRDRFVQASGLLFDFFDVPALARTVSEVLQDPHAFDPLAETAVREARARYDLESVCKPRQVQWLAGLLARAGAPSASAGG